MKKTFLMTFLMTVFILSVSAQQLKKGDGVLNVGAGFIPGVGANISYDHGIVDKWGPGLFTAGGFVGFSINSGNSFYTKNVLAFAPRVTYRYNINSSFEVYATAMLGVISYMYNYDGNYNNSLDNYVSTFGGGTAGCRYLFSEKISVFAEVGYLGTSSFNGGISITF